MSQEERYCDYELPQPFQLCTRRATVRIERNGCFCTQHAKMILGCLRRAGLTRHSAPLPRKREVST